MRANHRKENSNMIRLVWENEQTVFSVTEELISTLKACIEKTLQYENFIEPAEVSLTFTDNAGIHTLNLSVRGIDRPTDVLSFPLLETDEDGTLILYEEDFADGFVLLGDIMISTEKAVAQAEEYGHTVLRELAFLTVHSMLHLLGYDHERSAEEETQMFHKQEDILNLLNITR